MGPIVGRAVSIHLVRDTRLDEIYWRTTAGRAASNIQDSYVWVVRIEIPQFRVIVRDRFDKNRPDVLIRAVDKKSPERVTHYAIVCSDLNDVRFLPRTEVSFVKISEGARSGEHAAPIHAHTSSPVFDPVLAPGMSRRAFLRNCATLNGI